MFRMRIEYGYWEGGHCTCAALEWGEECNVPACAAMGRECIVHVLLRRDGAMCLCCYGEGVHCACAVMGWTRCVLSKCCSEEGVHCACATLGRGLVSILCLAAMGRGCALCLYCYEEGMCFYCYVWGMCNVYCTIAAMGCQCVRCAIAAMGWGVCIVWYTYG